MTETKSYLDIAQACREVSDALLDLSTDFDYYLAWKDHAQYLLSASSLLMIYAHQLEAKHD